MFISEQSKTVYDSARVALHDVTGNHVCTNVNQILIRNCYGLTQREVYLAHHQDCSQGGGSGKDARDGVWGGVPHPYWGGFLVGVVSLPAEKN